MAAGAIVGAHGRDVAGAEAVAAGPASSVRNGPISFRDVLDALNPLQFLPVVGTIYRVATGDDGSPTLRTAASLVGGALMGGPVGLLTSMAGVLVERVFPVEHLARDLIMGPAAHAAAAAPAPPPRLAAQAAAAYTRAGDLPGRIIPGGGER